MASPINSKSKLPISEVKNRDFCDKNLKINRFSFSLFDTMKVYLRYLWSGLSSAIGKLIKLRSPIRNGVFIDISIKHIITKASTDSKNSFTNLLFPSTENNDSDTPSTENNDSDTESVKWKNLIDNELTIKHLQIKNDLSNIKEFVQGCNNEEFLYVLPMDTLVGKEAHIVALVISPKNKQILFVDSKGRDPYTLQMGTQDQDTNKWLPTNITCANVLSRISQIESFKNYEITATPNLQKPMDCSICLGVIIKDLAIKFNRNPDVNISNYLEEIFIDLNNNYQKIDEIRAQVINPGCFVSQEEAARNSKDLNVIELDLDQTVDDNTENK